MNLRIDSELLENQIPLVTREKSGREGQSWGKIQSVASIRRALEDGPGGASMAKKHLRAQISKRADCEGKIQRLLPNTRNGSVFRARLHDERSGEHGWIR